MSADGQLDIFDYGRTSEWVKGMDTGKVMLECKLCRARVFAIEYRKAVGDHGFRYCPYCGATMKNPDAFNRPWRQGEIWKDWQKEEEEWTGS